MASGFLRVGIRSFLFAPPQDPDKGATIVLKFVLVCSLILLSGCSLIFIKPTVSFRELKLTDVDAKGMSLTLLLNVNNPNSYDITLDGYTYSFNILDLPLATGEKKQTVTFTGRKSTDLQVPMRVTYGNLFDILLKRPNPTSIPYQLAAGLDIVTPVGTMNFPVTANGTLAVPKDKLKTQMLKGIGESLGIK